MVSIVVILRNITSRGQIRWCQ